MLGLKAIDNVSIMSDPQTPLATLLLVTYNQKDFVGEAVAAALEQTYSPLEIIISDDASTDGTFDAIKESIAHYKGPHRVILNRNPVNLGIGAHFNFLTKQAKGQLIFVAAGDDISLPQRCEAVMKAWQASDRTLDLIASDLIDMGPSGELHETISPSDLSTYRNVNDWLSALPYVIGAAHAWSHRLIERFEPLPKGVVAEDMIMTFRAIVSGGACTLRAPLVKYRRGGISRRARTLRATDVIRRLLKNNQSTLIEIPQLIADARVAGCEPLLAKHFERKLARERYIQSMFSKNSVTEKTRLFFSASMLDLAFRIRIYLYGACPGIFGSFFFLKRLFVRKA
jgi:glycosyltransferase involved in cell wall biosynthesis